MLSKAALVCGGLAAVARASQPGAVSPVAAPMRELQWGQINFLHTTDTHGWHGGHLQESQYSADWGDYISFAHHLRKQADEKGVDLLLVDTGDRVEGNGLYDASTPKGEYTYDIYREQNVDIICTGNHELYQADTVEREHDRTVVNFKDTYIASNLDYVDPKSGERTPMTRRYRKFQTKNQKLNVVAFGFLFDFTGNANNSAVQPVEETIKEDWFQEAIREKPDLFVVIGHVGIRMDEFKVIFTAIRKQNWFTPIAFLGGHAHVRDATLYDAKAFAVASGRYFETIGWVSVDGIKKSDKDKDKNKEDDVTTQAIKFNRRYIDNNLLGLYHHSGLNETTFPTEHGRNVSKMITEGRKALDLDFTYGCAPQDYWMARTPYPHDNSIYSLLEKEVLPGVIVNETKDALPRLAIINTGAIRFDIFKGAFTRDTTYIISPFSSKMAYVPAVPYKVASKVIKLLNSGGRIFEGTGLDSRYLMMPEQWSRTESIVYPTVEPDLLGVVEEGEQRPLGDDSKDEPDLVGGYTTKDDIGNDGDDAVHSPLSFYAQPNCIQSEIGMPEDGDPDKVDLVFTDFVQPWVLVALKFSGGDYSDKDVKLWDDAPFTDLLAGWIKKNWKGDC